MSTERTHNQSGMTARVVNHAIRRVGEFVEDILAIDISGKYAKAWVIARTNNLDAPTDKQYLFLTGNVRTLKDQFAIARGDKHYTLDWKPISEAPFIEGAYQSALEARTAKTANMASA
jgi:hypothetical protein